MADKKEIPKKFDVKVYSTPTCAYCKMTKEFLKANKINYKEIDVSSDIKAAQDIVKRSGQTGVPVIEINEKLIIGFDKVALKKALKLN